MSGPATPDLPAALAALAGAFRHVGRPAMIIGGLAVIARGVPRQTIDIDAVIRADGLDIDTLIAAFGAAGFAPRVPDAAEFARQRQVLLLRHGASGVPLDLSLGWLPFEWDAIARATPVDLAGVTLQVATPEDLVVLKAVAWRDRDRGDIERLIVRHADAIDLQRVREVLSRFLEVLGESERLPAFEALVRRALDQCP